MPNSKSLSEIFDNSLCVFVARPASYGLPPMRGFQVADGEEVLWFFLEVNDQGGFGWRPVQRVTAADMAMKPDAILLRVSQAWRANRKWGKPIYSAGRPRVIDEADRRAVIDWNGAEYDEGEIHDVRHIEASRPALDGSRTHIIEIGNRRITVTGPR